jgi:hypothetical protein
MKKTLISLALLAIAGSAVAQLSYPGSNWSSLTYNPSPIKGTPEEDNILFQGNVEQGIVWTKYGDWKVNTYAAVAYSWDRNGLAYNNRISPALGVKLQRQWNGGNLDLGVQVVHQNTFRGVTEGASSGTGIQVYAQYWAGWDLKK